jgi:hypothetical protein
MSTPPLHPVEASATDVLSALCPDVPANFLKYLLNNHRAPLALGTSSFVRRGRLLPQPLHLFKICTCRVNSPHPANIFLLMIRAASLATPPVFEFRIPSSLQPIMSYSLSGLLLCPETRQKRDGRCGAMARLTAKGLTLVRATVSSNSVGRMPKLWSCSTK